MAEVDPNDDSVPLYLVRHHRFDPETNHFRWFTVKAFDNKKEMSKLLKKLWTELEARKLVEEVHYKEQYAGQMPPREYWYQKIFRRKKPQYGTGDFLPIDE